MVYYNELQAIGFFLILARVGGFFILSPFFGNNVIPRNVRVILSFILSVVTFLSMDESHFARVSESPMIVNLAFELMIGLVFGYMTLLVFSCFYVAGKFIDMQIGFAMVSIMDPTTNEEIPIMGAFYYNFALILFIIFDGPSRLVELMRMSLDVIKPGAYGFGIGVIPTVVKAFGDTFIIGMRVAVPIIAVILMTDVFLGIITKSVPQINVFILGMPVKIIVGLFVVSVSVPFLSRIVKELSFNLDNDIIKIIDSLKGF